jgi:ribonuclease HI
MSEAFDSRLKVAASAARVLVYCDGGCRGNPGIGGWASLLVDTATGRGRTLRGGAPLTTNNRMELLGAIEALVALQGARRTVEVRTDSKYVKDMCMTWMPGWKRAGWKRKEGPIKNLDLVQRLDALLQEHDVRFTWIKGHSGEPGNEYVDLHTNIAMDAVKRGLDPALDERHDRAPIALS